MTVAIPVRDGGPQLVRVLERVAAQSGVHLVEILVCDSGSVDGSGTVARAAGARVIDIPSSSFGHGRTRNLLVREARGEIVVFLTQDSTPADGAWLARLAGAFDDSAVGLACGPYLPAPGASVAVRRELGEFFGAMARNDVPRTSRVADLADPPRPGPATFHTSANGAVRRAAWAAVPFRDVVYAEDQLLALDMLGAGWSRTFVPGAAVVHSHDYPPGERTRRYFDEFRALHEIYGIRSTVHPRSLIGGVRAEVRADRAWARDHGVPDIDRATIASIGHHTERAVGAALGTRADRLPRAIRRRLSRDRLDGDVQRHVVGSTARQTTPGADRSL